MSNNPPWPACSSPSAITTGQSHRFTSLKQHSAFHRTEATLGPTCTIKHGAAGSQGILSHEEVDGLGASRAHHAPILIFSPNYAA